MKNKFKKSIFLGIIAALALGVAVPALATNSANGAKDKAKVAQADKVKQDKAHNDFLKKNDTAFNKSYREAQNAFNKEMRDARKAYQQEQKAAKNAFNSAIRSNQNQDVVSNAFNTYRNALVTALEKRAKYEQAAYSKLMATLRGLTFEPTINYTPVADSLTINSKINSAIGITLTGSDADGCGSQAFSYTIVNGPSNGGLSSRSGTASCNNGKITFGITYTPKQNFLGTDTFSFRVSDGRTTSATANVSVVVSQ